MRFIKLTSYLMGLALCIAIAPVALVMSLILGGLSIQFLLHTIGVI